MFISDTVVLTEQNKKAPPIAVRLRRKGGAYLVLGDNLPEKVFAIDECGTLFKCSGSPLSLPTDIGDCFIIAFSSGDNFYCGARGRVKINVKKIKKIIECENSKDVKIAYDDYAIATENYYSSSPLIHATFKPIMCEKGHFLKNDGQTLGQNSTSYPQGVDKDYETRNNNKIPISESYNEAENKQASGAEKKKEPLSFGETEGCGSGCIVPFYERVKESLNALFSSFPRVKELEVMLDGSTFIRVNYSENKHYVVGITVYNSIPEYIIFGIPNPSPFPPADFDGMGYYVPIKTGGYYLVYQNAQTGKLLSPQ